MLLVAMFVFQNSGMAITHTEINSKMFSLLVAEQRTPFLFRKWFDFKLHSFDIRTRETCACLIKQAYKFRCKDIRVE